MPSAAQTWIVLLGGLCLASAACRSPSQLSGRSSFEVINPAEPPPPSKASSLVAVSDIEVHPIPCYLASDLRKPIYPPDALAAHAGERIVDVSAAFTKDGRITDVTPSLGGIPDPSRFSGAFFDSVRAAVLTWTIQPPHNVYWQIVPGGERKYLRTEALSGTLELRFTFEANGTVN